MNSLIRWDAKKIRGKHNQTGARQLAPLPERIQPKAPHEKPSGAISVLCRAHGNKKADPVGSVFAIQRSINARLLAPRDKHPPPLTLHGIAPAHAVR